MNTIEVLSIYIDARLACIDLEAVLKLMKNVVCINKVRYGGISYQATIKAMSNLFNSVWAEHCLQFNHLCIIGT